MINRFIAGLKFSISQFEGKKRVLAMWIVLRALNEAITPILVPIIINLMINTIENGGSLLKVSLFLAILLVGALGLSCYIYVYSDAWIIKTMYRFQETSITDSLNILPCDRREHYSDAEVFNIINNGAWGMIQVWMKLFRIAGPAISLLLLLVFSGRYSTIFVLLILTSILFDFVLIRTQIRKNLLHNQKIITCKTLHEESLFDILYNVEFLSMNGSIDCVCKKHQMVRDSYWQQKEEMRRFNHMMGAFGEIADAGIKCFSYLVMSRSVNEGELSTGEVGASDSLIGNVRTEAQTIRSHVSSASDVLVPIERVEELLSLQRTNKHMLKPTHSNALEIKNICVSADNRMTLNNISLNIGIGEKVALIGHNGSGKSTLIKCIINATKPSFGAIYINGIDSRLIPVEELFNYCTYLPAHNILFSQSVSNNILMGAESDSTHFDNLLGQAGLLRRDSNIAARNAQYLSGGEAQRVSLIRSLVSGHMLYLLDEPTASLDAKTAKVLMDYVFNLSGTFIYTTHNPAEIKYADRIILLHKGEIKADMPLAEFMKSEYYESWLGEDVCS